ncbi:MAG TPA: class I SAM-dependent methyltransferase [Candidatus Dorea merdavium]|nr:class I SAM-dependent methyltransferase [Candidatus Dorea merdavium]
MELSKRLYAVAGLVTEGASVADIGTDHGYVPIYLVERGIASKVIAMDVNQGPLNRARMHIVGHGLGDRIETRLSDGLARIRPGEVDTVIVSGMGGPLTIRILQEGKEVADQLNALILQPQSEICRVRRSLTENGYRIEQEDMVLEDGKYYPVMRVVHGTKEPYEEWEYLYGKRLLEARHPVLLEFLKRELHIKESILEQLAGRSGSESARERAEEICREREWIQKALAQYEMGGMI